jgi:poly-beta-hydroxybutyrate-responsive repressor
LVPVILLTLREWNSYGYELMERAAAFGFEAMNPGTLYRTLRQMEKEGIVESTWETSRGGPARRMYSITGADEVLPGLLGQVARAVPEDHGRLLQALYGQAAA